jgi:hypothetical protein
MTQRRAHALLSALYIGSRLLLYAVGLRFSFALDWMWLADPADLRDRLLETLYYFHAFPPAMNALTGVLLKVSEANAPALAQGVYWTLGLVLVNVLLSLGVALGLSVRAALVVALAFVLSPPAIYFEHLYLYEWPVATLLCLSALAFNRAVRAPTLRRWSAFFVASALIGFTRSTFHLLWFAALVGLAASMTRPGTRRIVFAAALVPAVCLTSLYAKNLLLFGDFAASTFGPASYSLVTVGRLSPEVREAWIRDGRLSPFAAISVYAPPREYARYFSTPSHEGWPPQLTRLEQQSIAAPNYNHWWLLDVHRARRTDVLAYLRSRPLDYVSNVAAGVRALFGASTTWHPRDASPASPHHQHRQVLGGYEAWFNRLVHGLPMSPVGLYVLLPLVLVWCLVRARQLLRDDTAHLRARGALLLFCMFQIAYVVAASSMLTALEWPRYRFQIEWAIWLTAAAAATTLGRRVAAAIPRVRARQRTHAERESV